MLEDEIRALAARHAEAVVAVSVWDQATNTHLDIHGDRLFHAASTMKVAVMIEVFRQAEEGRLSLDDSIRVENRFRSIVDGSPFRIEDDSDDALYSLSGEDVPIRELVRRMITVSSNLATNLLIERVTAGAVQRTIEEMGVRRMKVLRGVEDLRAFEAGLSNSATAFDLALLLDAIRRGRAVSDEASREMVEILLDDEFNEMIPAGLPASARAAHKTGTITSIAHDAAIVYPDDGPSYVLVILTEGITDQSAAQRLGAEITLLVHSALRPSGRP